MGTTACGARPSPGRRVSNPRKFDGFGRAEAPPEGDPRGMEIDAYLDRIGFKGPLAVDEDTLTRLHQAHLESIPYENLDLQLGGSKPLDEASFAKQLVADRRGGWCYQMNGLFSAVLRQIGFRVDRVGGAVARHLIGDAAIANHMVLLVHLDRPIVADVGLGDGPLLPFPLEDRSWSEFGFDFALARLEDGWWRMTNHANGLAPAFDFTETPRALDWYAPRCEELQTSEASPFTQLAMTFRRDRTRVRALRELTYIEIEGPEKTEREVGSLEEYTEVLLPLIDFELGADLERLYACVRDRVAKRRAEAARRSPENG